MRIQTSTRMRRVASLAVATLAIAVLPAAAIAAKPTKLSLSVPDGTYATSATAWVGDGTLSTASAESTGMKVKAECYQDGALVYRQYANVVGSTATLTLGPTPAWTGGAATCTAELGSFDKRVRWRAVASDSFSVTG